MLCVCVCVCVLRSVYAQLMDRSQQRLCMLLIPLECFVLFSDADVDMHSFDRTRYPPVQCIYEESSPIWINVSCLRCSCLSFCLSVCLI